MSSYTVRVHWDADAQVWWANSEDVPGLVAEATTFECLIDDIRDLVPQLLRLNRPNDAGSIHLTLVAERSEDLHPA